jgi:hypothetical protein
VSYLLHGWNQIGDPEKRGLGVGQHHQEIINGDFPTIEPGEESTTTSDFTQIESAYFVRMWANWCAPSFTWKPSG